MLQAARITHRPWTRTRRLRHRNAAFAPLRPKHVLVVVAHADDAECHAGGTIRQFADLGAEITLLVLTDGSNGSSDPTATAAAIAAAREAEQLASAREIGITHVIFGRLKDGALENTPTLRLVISRAIRQSRAEVLITWDPQFRYDVAMSMYNHRDHRVTGDAACDAVYPEARDPHSHPELLAEGLHPHAVTTVLMITSTTSTNFPVWLSPSQHAAKHRGITLHQSQQGLAAEAYVFEGAHSRRYRRLWTNVQAVLRRQPKRTAEAFRRLDVSTVF